MELPSESLIDYTHQSLTSFKGGHEGTGIVVALGEDVNCMSVGDRVGIQVCCLLNVPPQMGHAQPSLSGQIGLAVCVNFACVVLSRSVRRFSFQGILWMEPFSSTACVRQIMPSVYPLKSPLRKLLL